MGRPRKRQFIESANDHTASTEIGLFDLDSVPFVDADFNSFMDGMIAEPYFTNGLSATLPQETTMQEPASTLDNGHGAWNFSDREIMGVPPINFGDIDFGTVDHTTPPLDPTPQLSSDSNNSVSSEDSPSKSIGGPGCSCLASMYLSLASLQDFPSDIVTALRTVRSACATAASSVWCHKCGTVLLDNPNPPIEAFQNVMLLGTILPIIANGYHRLLQMIDDETKTAVSLGRTKTFRFHDYGGMCRQQATAEDKIKCFENGKFSHPIEMSPTQWRTTVRALLRVDIYGHEQPGFKHRGLKDLVAEMETRQKARHEMLDAYVAAGGQDALKNGPFAAAQFTGGHGHTKCAGEQTHGCLQILQIAKVAIDNLVIA